MRVIAVLLVVVGGLAALGFARHEERVREQDQLAAIASDLAGLSADQHEVMQLRNEVLALLHLHRLEREQADTGKMFVVVISTGERKFGLVVDHLVGEEELVIKAMDDHLVATDLVSGASILGDGTVVLILNLSSVVAKLGKLQMVGATA